MQNYLLEKVASLIIFCSVSIILILLLYIRKRILISKLGGIITTVSLLSKKMIIARYILLSFLIIITIAMILIFIFLPTEEYIYRFIGDFIFVISLNYSLRMYSDILICKDGFAGAGFPKTFWDGVKGVIWDKDIGQREWGVKIFIHGLKRPYRAYFNRGKKEEIENVFDEFIKQTIK